MLVYLATLKEGKLKKALNNAWVNWVIDDKDGEKSVWDFTRTKLKGVNDKLLEQMKNAGSIETDVGPTRIQRMKDRLSAFEAEFGEFLKTRGKYEPFTPEDSWTDESMNTIMSRLEKAVEAGFEIPAEIEDLGDEEE